MVSGEAEQGFVVWGVVEVQGLLALEVDRVEGVGWSALVVVSLVLEVVGLA